MSDFYHKEYRSVYKLTVHLVLVCKYRHELLANGRLSWVENVLTETAQKWDCTVLEISGESDHVHLLIDYPPKTALSKLIANLKTVSSRLFRKEFGLAYSLWTGSYFVASCGGVTVEALKAYVQGQSRPEDA